MATLVACSQSFSADRPSVDGGMFILPDASSAEVSRPDTGSDAALSGIGFLTLESTRTVYASPADAGGGDAEPDADVETDAGDAAAKPSERYSFGAFFVRSNDLDSSSSSGAACTTTGHGVCDARRCPANDAGDPADAAVAVPPRAGTITVTGAATQGETVLVPTAAGVYPTKRGSRTLWQGGETLAFTWQGASGGVSAGSGSLAAPRAVDLTVPLAETIPAGTLSIPRSDLAMSWPTAGQPADARVSVVFGATTQAGEEVTVTCTFPASAGSASLPASALLEIPAGAGFFRAVTNTSGGVINAGWSVVFDLVSEGTVNGFTPPDVVDFR